MIRPVIGTIATRLVVTAANLLVIMIAGHTLGTVGLGEISLIVLGITFIMLLNNVVGGGALVYLVPRHPLRQLLAPAYGWALATAAVAWGLLHLLPLVPDRYVSHVVVLALLQSLYTVHFGFLLGRQRIRSYNLIVTVQALVLLAAFVALVALRPGSDVMAYVLASYASFGITLVLSAVLALRGEAPPSERATEGVWRSLFRHGGLIQVANLLQLLNYRLAYYLIEAFRGTGALGLYAVANQLAESAWLAPKSLGMVLYSRLSNTAEADRQRDLTLTVTKAAVAFAVAVVLVLLLVPEPLFALLFGKEVRGLPPLVLLLAPGIVAMAASQAFSHYFSGVGRNLHNAVGSAIGLVVTLAAGSHLIPAHGLEGAAMTASMAYCGNALYQAVVFLRSTGTAPRMLWFTRADAQRLGRIWRSAWRS